MPIHKVCTRVTYGKTTRRFAPKKKKKEDKTDLPTKTMMKKHLS